MEGDLPKLIAVVGPTASGKSGLAHEIAQSHSGELVCADSRQIYQGLDIGSAKDPGEWKTIDGERAYMLNGVREHLVDMVGPNEEFNVGLYQARAFKAIDEILDREALPIVVGGTGLYVQAILDNLKFPDVAPNPHVRAQLEKKSLAQLQATYAACDPVGALSIDHNNRRRLIRGIEVCWVAQKPFSELQGKGPQKFDALQLAFDLPREQLNRRIDHRVIEMIKAGLVEEVEGLLDEGADPRKSALSGIGYQEVVRHLYGDISFDQMVEQIQRNSRRLAKKQLSWFRRDASIVWVHSVDEALEHVQTFLNK